MFEFIKKLFGFKTKENVEVVAPYKIEVQPVSQPITPVANVSTKPVQQNKKPRSRKPQGQKQAQTQPQAKAETTQSKPRKPRGRRPNPNKTSNKPVA